jgi:hypothetical protein
MSTNTSGPGQLMARQDGQLRDLEGRRISLALADGSRLDDVTLVSAGRGRTPTLWLDVAGIDVFVDRLRVVDVWEPVARWAAA